MKSTLLLDLQRCAQIEKRSKMKMKTERAINIVTNGTCHAYELVEDGSISLEQAAVVIGSQGYSAALEAEEITKAAKAVGG